MRPADMRPDWNVPREASEPPILPVMRYRSEVFACAHGYGLRGSVPVCRSVMTRYWVALSSLVATFSIHAGNGSALPFRSRVVRSR